MKDSPVFVLSPGRSGTAFMANFFRANLTRQDWVCLHEPGDFNLMSPTVKELSKGIDGRAKLIKGCKGRYIETNHAFIRFFYKTIVEFCKDLRVVHVVRNPTVVAASYVNRGDNVKDSIYHIHPKKSEFMKSFDDEWTRFQSFLWDWYEVNARALSFLSKKSPPCFILNFKDINDPTMLQDLLGWVFPRFKGVMLHKYLDKNENLWASDVSDRMYEEATEWLEGLDDASRKVVDRVNSVLRIDPINLWSVRCKSGQGSHPVPSVDEPALVAGTA